MNSKVAEIINERLVKSIEKGTAPWVRPWRISGVRNQNLKTKHEYTGINAMITAVSGFASPYWLTFNQVKEINGKVRTGEHGTQVVFWSFLDSKTEKMKDGRPKQISFMRYYTIFNASQIEGIESRVPEAPPFIPKPPSVIDSYTRSGPKVSHGGDKAFYSVSGDHVGIPAMNMFGGESQYWQTLFHELAHSTRHSSRLDRNLGYAKEELVAEIAACYMMNECGMEPDIEESASYLDYWMRQLREDPMLFISASSKADAACRLMLNECIAKIVQDNEEIA